MEGFFLQCDLNQQFAGEPDSGIVWFQFWFWFWFGLIDNMHATWLNCTWKDFLRVDPDLQFANYPEYPDRQVTCMLHG